jgi:hypothetical protein
MRPVLVAAFAAALVGVATPRVSARQAGANPPAITYESYCKLDRMGKQEARRTMTPALREELWRTQLERFRDANIKRLSADQVSLIKEWIAVLPAAVAPGAASDETTAKLKALEGRLTSAFSKDDLRAMDDYGPCIAKTTISN